MVFRRCSGSHNFNFLLSTKSLFPQGSDHIRTVRPSQEPYSGVKTCFISELIFTPTQPPAPPWCLSSPHTGDAPRVYCTLPQCPLFPWGVEVWLWGAETELGSSVLRAGSKLLTSLQRGMQAFNLGCDMPALDLRPSSLIASCGLGKQMVFLHSLANSLSLLSSPFFLKKESNLSPNKVTRALGQARDTSIPEAFYTASRGKKKRCAGHFV